MLNSVKDSYNRKTRRTAFLEIKKLGSKGWGEWEEIDHKKFSRETGHKSPKDLIRAWKNNIFIVQLYLKQTPDGDEIQKLMIRRNDESTKVSWADKQRIKNELMGEETFMIECFPPQDLLIDCANMYWLWSLPKGSYPFLADSNTQESCRYVSR